MSEQPNKALTPHSLHEDVANSLEWAASLVQERLSDLAKGAGMTLPQYRVLRILRDAGEPLSCGEIANRMIARDPDITRLIDKLAKAGLVERTRDERDRRVVRSMITETGANKVEPLDEGVSRVHQELLEGIPESELHEWSRRLRALMRAT